MITLENENDLKEMMPVYRLSLRTFFLRKNVLRIAFGKKKFKKPIGVEYDINEYLSKSVVIFKDPIVHDSECIIHLIKGKELIFKNVNTEERLGKVVFKRNMQVKSCEFSSYTFLLCFIVPELGDIQDIMENIYGLEPKRR